MHRLKLNHKPIFDQYLSKVPDRDLSSYAFVSHWIWRDFFDYRWEIIDDHFCLFADQLGDLFMPIPPIGESHSSEVIFKCFDRMRRKNRNPQIARIENVSADGLPFFESIGCDLFEKEVEYFYERESLVLLRGDRHKSQRNAINNFLRNYRNLEIVDYNRSDFSECLELYRNWKIDRESKFSDEIYRIMINDCEKAFCVMLENFEDLGNFGKIVRINGILSGCTFGVSISTEIFCVLFEIADLSIRGLSKWIFREFCRSRSEKWINTMSDSGLENLRRAKLSYNPICEIVSYNVLMKIENSQNKLRIKNEVKRNHWRKTAITL